LDTKKYQPLTGVWQNGGISAKLSICTSINISANLNICTSNPPLRQAPNRCTKGSLRSPSVQRAAAAPQLHKVLPPVALRTTAVLRNSEKKSSLRSIFFGTSQSRSALQAI